MLLFVISLATWWPQKPIKVSIPGDALPIEVIARYQAELSRAMTNANLAPSEEISESESWEKNGEGLWEIVPNGEKPYPEPKKRK